jgi:hypothetical protein
MYISIDFSSQIVAQRGSLVPQQGGLIHQFGICLGFYLKNRLLLLLYWRNQQLGQFSYSLDTWGRFPSGTTITSRGVHTACKHGARVNRGENRT